MINKNAEASIISACMFSELAVTKSIEKLTAEDFRDITHRNMFEAISDLFNDNKSIDMLTIADRMTENGKEVDMLHINDISDLVMLDTSIDSHIDIVKKNTLTINTKKITAEIGNKIARNEDIAEVIDYGREEFMNIDTKDKNLTFTAEEAAMTAVQQTQEIQTNKVQIGLQTDIYELNKFVIFKKQEVVVVAAKKSVGKSALLSQFALYNARKGKRGAFIMLEGTASSLTNREISRIGSIDYGDITMGRMNAEQMERYREASEIFSKYPILISTERGLTFPQIHSKLVTFKNILGRLDWIVIDYIQKIKTNKGHSRQRELADLSEEFTTMAQHFDCPTFIGSQVNHEGITREAEDLENDADIVLKLRRPVFEHKSKFVKTTQFPQLNGDDMPNDYATLQITKNRNGRTGGVELRSMLEFQRFEDWQKVY